MSLFNFSSGQPLFQNLFGGTGANPMGMMPKSSASAMPGNIATAMGERSKNPWNIQNLMDNKMMKLGIGLLAQNRSDGPQRSVGQDISRAMQGVQASEDEEMARQYRQMQLQQMQQQQQMAMQFFRDPQGYYNGGMSGVAMGAPRALTPPVMR